MTTGYAASYEPAMRAALAEAQAAAQGKAPAQREAPVRGQAPGGGPDVPVGAVILDERNEVLVRARNRREAGHDPTAHAEIVAIREAGRLLGTWRLTGLTLVVTLEPCTMCAGAVTAARLARLVYGADDPRAGAVGSLWDVVRDPRLGHWPEVIGGVLGSECGDLLRRFFSELR